MVGEDGWRESGKRAGEEGKILKDGESLSESHSKEGSGSGERMGDHGSVGLSRLGGGKEGRNEVSGVV